MSGGSPMKKRCSKCGLEKLIDEFYSNLKSRAKDGKQSRCKDCAKASAIAQRLADPEKANRLRAEWAKRNPEKERAWATQKRANRLEHYNALSAERQRKYRATHPDRVKADALANNAERIARWRLAHPGREGEQRFRRRATIKHRLGWADVDGMKTMYELARIYRDAGIPCEVDHIVPLKHPLVTGLHVLQNLALVQKHANRSKGNRTWPDMPTGA
jgi:hypothetical protein